ncbi:MAG: GH3 auxin-responsive promoter family protein [Dongiales bacterium]
MAAGSGVQGEIDRYMRHYDSPRETQASLLASILRRNAGTEFGKEHGFARIRSAADYQRQVPIRQWVDLAPYVDGVIEGRPGVLTRERPFFYHRTTGTTGVPKMIPVTRRCEALSKITHRFWVLQALKDNPRMLDGRVMAVLNTVIDGYTPRHEAYGTVSGNIYYRLPAILRRAYAHPYDVYAVENVEARRYALTRYALDKECSLAFTGNPMGLVTAFDFADKHSETLIRDIHDGTLSPEFPLPDALHAAALNQLPPNPRRARALAAAREKAGRLRPTDYWPGFSLAACWIGGSMGHFTPRLRDWCGEGVPFRDAGYMASEGIFTVPQANDSVDGLPALHAVFFEFLAEHDFGKPDAPALLAHELEPGRNYHVVVTTTGGLYRYAMNDVVRAGVRQQETPLLRFLYKGGHVQNMQGEMLSIEHVMATMAALAAETGVRLRHFQVIAEIDRRRYALHIEPADAPSPGQLRQLLAGFDRALGAANENYTIFRTDKMLNPPRLAVMQKGWLERITADHLARSGRDSQFKPAVLASAPEHPEMVEQSLAWSGDERGERRAAGE